MSIKLDKTAFIMPHRDRYKSLCITLKSLYRSICANDIKLILVDDYNNYDVEDIISSYTDNYEIIRNNKRYGADTSKGIGIKYANKKGIKHIIILDDDLIFDINWLLVSVSLYFVIPKRIEKKSIVTSFVTPYYKYKEDNYIQCSYCRAYQLVTNHMPMSVGNVIEIKKALEYYVERKIINHEGEFVVEWLFRSDVIDNKLYYYVKEGKSMIGHFGRHSMRGKYERVNPDWGNTVLGHYLPSCSDDVLEQIKKIMDNNENWGKK